MAGQEQAVRKGRPGFGAEQAVGQPVLQVRPLPLTVQLLYRQAVLSVHNTQHTEHTHCQSYLLSVQNTHITHTEHTHCQSHILSVQNTQHTRSIHIIHILNLTSPVLSVQNTHITVIHIINLTLPALSVQSKQSHTVNLTLPVGCCIPRRHC